MSKPKFCRCRGIAIRCTQDYFHIKVADALTSLFTAMVSGTIHNYYSSFSITSSVLLGQCLREMRQEHLHYLFIRIALSQWQPRLTFRWYCYNHINSLGHDLIRLGVSIIASVPTCSPEVRARKPGFVQVYNMVLLLVYLKHLLCVQAAKDFVPLWVSKVRYSLDATITQSVLWLHHMYDGAGRHFHTKPNHYYLLNLFHIPNILIQVDGVLDGLRYSSLL